MSEKSPSPEASSARAGVLAERWPLRAVEGGVGLLDGAVLQVALP